MILGLHGTGYIVEVVEMHTSWSVKQKILLDMIYKNFTTILYTRLKWKSLNFPIG